MRSVQPDDHVHEFVLEVLRTGMMLADLIADLTEAIPTDAYPGESAVEVVLEMMVGTIRPVADAAGEEAVRQACELVADAAHRVLTDLRLAAELARLRERAPSSGEGLN